MSDYKQRFISEAAKAISDRKRKIQLQKALSGYSSKNKLATDQFMNLDLVKKRAGAIRQRVIENLDKYLIEFESNFNKTNGKLIWAVDSGEALRKIEEILVNEGVTSVIKSKSMVTEEIGLNDFLEERGIETVETDLGEFIQQRSKEPPYHIVTPCLHKSKTEINELLHSQLGTPINAGAEEITGVVNQFLRKNFTHSLAGITGANFLIADSGAVAITENEGNAFFSVTSPKIHLAITGIEKILPAAEDLELFWPLLASYGTGQKLTTYNHLIRGSKKDNEQGGPEKFYLILLDNGRSDLLAKPKQRTSLACIRCGACYNVCPVYKNIGGHSYNSVYGGPIGKVISPYINQNKNLNHLSHASSLCGACTEVCPVNIPLHQLLLENRKDDSLHLSAGEKLVWRVWKKAMLNRRVMDRGGSMSKNALLNLFFKNVWGNERLFPKVAKKSFNQIMRERLKFN